MAVLMRHQKRDVVKVPEPLQPQSNGGESIDVHGDPISAEESYEKINRGLRLLRKNPLAPLQRFFCQDGRGLRPDKRPKVTVIFLLDLPDPLGDLPQVKMVKVLPVGEEEIFMGLQVEALVRGPGVTLPHLIQEIEKIEIQRMNLHSGGTWEITGPWPR
jgi:hypothetical protein